jgi:PPK2 family polyphosphate:nucleotide phosphotransferase
MPIPTETFRVKKGQKIDLNKWVTVSKPLYGSDKAYEEMSGKQADQLSKLQNVFYANNTYSLLLIFQAMDAAGKDGAIKRVMYGINPQGCQVYSFKHPSLEELDHDFLWRTTRCLPERGRIGIFNRSYYEDVLIVRVHPEILAAQNLPKKTLKNKSLWASRFESIRGFEEHLHDNGTRVLKFFLHLSKEEQRKRFLKRLEDPSKNWKFAEGDIKERGFWKDYMKAYEQCFEHTSTKHAPWYIVPADDKNNADLIISQVVIDAMKSLHIDYPKLDAKKTKELSAIRKKLEAERK